MDCGMPNAVAPLQDPGETYCGTNVRYFFFLIFGKKLILILDTQLSK